MTAPAPPAGGVGHRRGEPAFRRMLLALSAAGISTFGLLYTAQPLLPLLSAAFRVEPAAASLAVSAATGALALGLPVAGALADRLGRKTVMTAALFGAAGLTVAAAYAPSWPVLIALRALMGLALAGVPAVAMAYVAAETEPASAGHAMGLYVAATAAGGMLGRLASGFAAEVMGWRGALLLTGLAGAAVAALFVLSLPPPRARAAPATGGLRDELRAAREALADPHRRGLFLQAFLLMGAFVTVYNYLPFRLAAPPYRLGQAALSAVFALYACGIAASSATGAAVARFGRGSTLLGAVALTGAGLALTLAAPLWAVVAGVGVFTFGFFAAHATASGWVGERGGGGRATGASLYLLAYYAGSSVLGTAGGWLWSGGGWTGVALGVGTALAIAFAAALRLARQAPPVAAAASLG